MKKRLMSLLLSFALLLSLVTVIPIQAEAADDYEYAVFGMEYMNISQGYGPGTYSHQNNLAIDYIGKGSGTDIVYAPFTCRIVQYASDATNHIIWAESVDKVHFADGTLDYMTIMMAHKDDITEQIQWYKNGTIIKQGEPLYQEGMWHYPETATGNHVHVECGKGKCATKAAYWSQRITNYVAPENAFFVLESDDSGIFPFSGTTIGNTKGYSYKTISLEKCDYRTANGTHDWATVKTGGKTVFGACRSCGHKFDWGTPDPADAGEYCIRGDGVCGR